MKQHALRVSDELWEQIETTRGRKSRNAWLVEVVTRAVELPEGTLTVPVRYTIKNEVGARVHRANCGCPVCKPPKKEKGP